MTGRGRFGLFAIVAVLNCGAIAGCGFRPSEPAAELAVPTTEDADDARPAFKVLAEESVIQVEDTTITIASDAAQSLDPIQVGDFVVGSKGYGFLRQVDSVSVEPADGSVVLNTNSATLADILPHMSIEMTANLAEAAVRGQGKAHRKPN